MSDSIFYTQVNGAVQRELIARGAAGVTDRSTKALNFMVGKIANVIVKAYASNPTVDSNPIGGFGILGGITVLGGAYQPSGPDGFLNDKVRPTHRIPPVITDVSIEISDQSKGHLNKATFTILVPDGTTDLFEIEEIYCKPGRPVRIQIVHPDDAIITDPFLDDDTLPSTQQLKDLFPGADLLNLRKMNEFFFQGKISTFTFSYSKDGSVSVSITAIGSTSTYIDLTTYINKGPQTTTTETTQISKVDNIYTSLIKEIDEITATYEKQGKTEFEHLTPNTTDQGIIVGTLYDVGGTKLKQKKMISLGYLINFINAKIITNIAGPTKIVCNDTICFSNVYERLVSADPDKLVLWHGKSDIITDLYYLDSNPRRAEKRLQTFPKVEPVSPGFIVNGQAFPSRIYIDTLVIKTIVESLTDIPGQLDTQPTIKNLLIKISEIISDHTGKAINMVLVQHPAISEALLYTDSFYTKSTTNISEFTLPVFATKNGASVVQEFSLTSNVPTGVQQLIYGVDSANTGTQIQVAYNPYIYADAAGREKFQKEWKQKHDAADLTLGEAKNNLALRPAVESDIKFLKDALAAYVTYYYDDISKSIEQRKSVFPMDLEFTIDGINGFRFANVLSFGGLPKRYTDSFVFTILGITHKVDQSGAWKTTIKCVPRVRITS